MIESLPTEKDAIEDLHNSPSKQTLIDLLSVVCQEVNTDLMVELGKDNIRSSIKVKRLGGYLTAMNDVIELLQSGLKNSLSNEVNP